MIPIYSVLSLHGYVVYCLAAILPPDTYKFSQNVAGERKKVMVFNFCVSHSKKSVFQIYRYNRNNRLFKVLANYNHLTIDHEAISLMSMVMVKFFDHWPWVKFQAVMVMVSA